MTTANSASLVQRRKTATVLWWAGANRHFLLAAFIMLAAAAVIWCVGTERAPVPWPPGVAVNQDFRMLSLPEKIGPYAKVTEDGVLFKERDGQPDGETIFKEDELRALGIGTTYDRQRREDRRSNWYVSRVYEDARPAARNSPYRYWRVEVYYYTGVDKVPHVPERCLDAAGSTLLKRAYSTFTVPAARSPWDEPIDFRHVHYERPGREGIPGPQGVEYYVFSLNGRPEKRWERIRLELSVPWVKYCYFAKIQFAPLGLGRGVRDVSEADAFANEFINCFLPAALQALPTHSAVEELASTKGAPWP